MTTNLLATITVILVTNITERVPMNNDLIPCPEGRPGCLVAHWGPSYPIPDATQKWIRTQIKEQTKLDYTNGLPSVVIAEKILSDYETEFKKEVAVTWTPVNTKKVNSEMIWNNYRSDQITVSNYYTTNLWLGTLGALTNNAYIITNK